VNGEIRLRGKIVFQTYLQRLSPNDFSGVNIECNNRVDANEKKIEIWASPNMEAGFPKIVRPQT